MKKLLLLTTLLAGGITMFAQHQHYLITGTYTHGISKGIYVHLFDSQTGTAKEVSFIEAGNPSYLVVSPDGKFVYAVHEEANPKTGGAVSAYSFHNGKLTLLNTQPTNGAHPCYIAIDQTGKWVTVANYSGGSLALFPIKENGSLDAASSFIQHTGSGPDKDRQEAPHVHSTVIAPDNKHVLASDLGLDRIAVYEVKGTTPTLAPAAEPFVSTTPASGPRHLVFAPNKKFAYMIEELSGHVVVYKWKKGKLKAIQRLSSLAPGQREFAGSADIRVSPDGRYLYASNRAGYNNIAIYRIDDKKGTLTLRGHQPTLGKTPRHFNFDPSGRYLLVGNQNSNEVVVFLYNAGTGSLTDTNHRIKIGSPVSFGWIKAN